jgi:hypothetical protein
MARGSSLQPPRSTMRGGGRCHRHRIHPEELSRWVQARELERAKVRATFFCVVCGGQFARPRSAVAGVRRTHCSRQCYFADPDRRSVRATLRERAGRCGSPTCRDLACAVTPGHCHREGCRRRARLAPCTRQTSRWVAGDPVLYCSQRCAVVARNAGQRWGASYEQLKSSAGLIDVDEAAARLGRVRHGVMAWARRLDVGQQIEGMGKNRAWLFSLEDIETIREHTSRSRFDTDPEWAAAWYLSRHGSIKKFGPLAKQIAERQGRKVGRHRRLSPEIQRQIRDLADRGITQRAIPRIMKGRGIGVTRSQVRTILKDEVGENPG